MWLHYPPALSHVLHPYICKLRLSVTFKRNVTHLSIFIKEKSWRYRKQIPPLLTNAKLILVLFSAECQLALYGIGQSGFVSMSLCFLFLRRAEWAAGFIYSMTQCHVCIAIFSCCDSNPLCIHTALITTSKNPTVYCCSDCSECKVPLWYNSW